MTNRIAALALCTCALTACGGGGDDQNAATARNFSYGPAEVATTPSSASDAIARLGEFQSAGDESSAVAAQSSLMQVAFDALGDDMGIGSFPASEEPAALVRQARSRSFATALAAATAEFTPACTVVTRDASGTTTVVFKDCRYSETTAEGTLTVTAAGTMVGRPGAVAWDVTYNLAMTAQDATMSFGYHDVGNIALAAATVKAHQEADIGATVSSGGEQLALGLAQSVDIDVTIDGACATTITGGTLEAKRVWTRRPAGSSDVELADRGALFTWTGCGVANVRFSR